MRRTRRPERKSLLFGQTSPELAMRDFSSGQIKKGVRSIGFGGDGATWGNYGLVWKDAGTALLDYGDTSYSNGNDFHFEAVGATTPPLWHDLAIYLIAMTETTNDVRFSLKPPGLGPGATPVSGRGNRRRAVLEDRPSRGPRCVGRHPALLRNLTLRRELGRNTPGRSPVRDTVAPVGWLRSRLAADQAADVRLPRAPKQRS